MDFVAFVTLLLLAQYLYFCAMTGKAREEFDIKAPATTGNDIFERTLRVQLNTLEQLLVTLPAMWLCAHYFSASFAGIMGLVFFTGRFLYRKAYIADPGTRTTGMIMGFLANILLLICATLSVIF